MVSNPKIQDYDDDDPLIEQRKKRWDPQSALKLVRKA